MSAEAEAFYLLLCTSKKGGKTWKCLLSFVLWIMGDFLIISELSGVNPIPPVFYTFCSDDVRADGERIFSLHLLHVYSGHSAPQTLIPAQACGHSCRTHARWLHVLFSHIISWVCFHPLDKLYSVSISLSPMVLIIPEIDRHWKAMFWIWTISALHLVLWLDPFLGMW